MSPLQEAAISAFFDAVAVLEDLNVIRSSRFLGDIGEFLCSSAFGTALVPHLRQPGHDGLHGEERVQIKFNNSTKGNNIAVGNPDNYDELVVVLGPRSKLRENDHGPGEYRLYRFSSAEVRDWKTGKSNYYCAKQRIAASTRKHRLMKRVDVDQAAAQPKQHRASHGSAAEKMRGESTANRPHSQMMFELSQTFYFEAAHTLAREVDTASSKRIHGHTYHAEVVVRGVPDPATGMLMDLGLLRGQLAEVRGLLDHHLLDEVEGLAQPTLEGLCAFIVKKLRAPLPQLASVKVWRATGDACRLTLS